ncbi:hypothetical protein SY2F82_22090 [Streptomyces sp. Y2F8-2]|uniref:M48 family metalloprotease n=1 Tax=Streptomyces sp. Y2F8-2 TaxID=2759675 RepID=UPI001906CE61|nr:M48 family metalloprotease [Streptomyces sp. Y2F8-2]GHK00412.1 hypothetical protein SY2F82_22090 [Streptomyces sp. Y2F8-2]
MPQPPDRPSPSAPRSERADITPPPPHPKAPPPYPEAPPAYPGDPVQDASGPGGPPQYPGTAPPQYPGAIPPQYPAAAEAPPSPETAEAPPSPEAAEAPPYPEAAEAPPYPEAAAPPPYPVAPRHTETAAALHRPEAPPYPTETAAALHRPEAPPYPGSAPPAYPEVPPDPPRPAAPLTPPTPEASPTAPAPTSPSAPDDLDYRHQGARIHISAHQRGADATAWGRLIMYIPGFVASFAVVASISVALAGNIVGWLVVAAWLFSGGLAFHRPTERLFARRVLKLRRPEPDERARLEPVWHEVTARAGIEAHTYELMVENSDDLNAAAVAGHIVGVTTYALGEVPSSHLAAVLAHELGHHTGGHSWAGLLGYWYSLPGRIAWNVASFLAIIAVYVASRINMLVATALFLVLAGFALMLSLAYWPIALSLLVAPYFLAYTARKSELRADEQAVALGFAQEMTEVLQHLQTQEAAQRDRAASAGEQPAAPGALTRLLSSHPGHQERLRALEPHLAINR